MFKYKHEQTAKIEKEKGDKAKIQANGERIVEV